MAVKREYFTINESSARTAHNMRSFRDYAEGSTTEEYRRAVDKAYDLAERVAAERPEDAERVYRLAGRYSKKMSEYYNKESSIGMMCPSMMISGGSNFPVKKKRSKLRHGKEITNFTKKYRKSLQKLKTLCIKGILLNLMTIEQLKNWKKS